jgi:hypothetical protein
VRAVTAVLVLLLLPAILPPAEAAPPQAMIFNGQPSADVKGPVRAVSVDGPGRWGMVAVGDEPTNLQDPDLVAYNLAGQSKGWEAADLDLVNEGAKLVALANGTQGGDGQWVVLVNNTVPSILSIFQANGFGPGGSLGRVAWQVNPDSGPINDVDINNVGDLVAVATGGAAQNKTILLVRNKFINEAPRVLYRANPSGSDFNDVVQFNAVALSGNTSVPFGADSTRAAYMVVGARTTTTTGIGGSVYLFETAFNSGPDTPTTRQVFRFDTSSPVVEVDMTADGEYAVAGTETGQVYLVSVSEALQRRGSGNLQAQLSPWQQALGARVNALRIAAFGGEFFAAGADNGDVVLFRNERNPSGSVGAQAVQVASANVNTPACGATRLSGAVASLDLSDYGDELVVGAQNGVLGFEAAAFARFRPGPFEPAWCIPFAAGDVRDGAQVDVSGNGRRVFAGSGHRVFGYNNFHCIKIDSQAGASRGGAPGQRVQWALTVRNDGSLFERVNLSVSGPLDPGWEFALSNNTLLLMPGKSQVVLLNVTSPQTTAPGNFSLTLLANAERAHAAAPDMRCQGHATGLGLRLDLGQLRRVELRPPTSTLIAQAGSSNTFPITLYNGGNAPDRFRVTARIPEPEASFKSRGSEWLLRVDPAEVEVPANSEGTVNLVVTPQAQRGDTATVELTVEPAVPSQDGSAVFDVKQVHVAVEPSYNGDIALAEARDLTAEPGQLVFINYTVKNLGNSNDIFVVRNHTEPANAPGFRLQLSDERFELRTQNAQKTVRLSVFVQQGVQPGESVRIVVDLFSEGLAKETPGSDGQVDSQPVTLTVVPKVRRGLPMAPEPLVFLGVLALAVALRRREEA